MSDALRNLQFKDGGSSSENGFIKFKADVPVKLRVFTTNPTIHLNQWGKEQISFAVWNYDENKAMILSKGASIARQISSIHKDEDFGADITQLDIKITPTGEDLNREYSINVLPKAQKLTDEQLEELADLDKNLDKILKSSIRADAYNAGERPKNVEEDLKDMSDPINLDEIPFN